MNLTFAKLNFNEVYTHLVSQHEDFPYSTEFINQYAKKLVENAEFLVIYDSNKTLCGLIAYYANRLPEAVLEKAKEQRIDGIMSFAVDPGVVTAAYVAEKLGLPFGVSYEAARILQNKDLFRQFLTDNGFNVPVSGGYSDFESAYNDLDRFTFPLIVKPTDSAGSKGVTRVDTPAELPSAFDHALKNSISGKVIIEEFIEKEGCSSDTDSFSVNGELKVVTFSAQRFDDEAANPYTPSAYSWPSTFTKEQEKYLTTEIQRLITLLGITTSIFNIETRIGKNGKPYIMELSPRGGGNRLAEMVRYGTGIDMITSSVKAMVGEPINELKSSQFDGHWAEIILHADTDGCFNSLEIEAETKRYVIEEDLWVKNGDYVKPFSGANDAIGTLVLRYPNQESLEKSLKNIKSWCRVRLNKSYNALTGMY